MMELRGARLVVFKGANGRHLKSSPSGYLRSSVDLAVSSSTEELFPLDQTTPHQPYRPIDESEPTLMYDSPLCKIIDDKKPRQ